MAALDEPRFWEAKRRGIGPESLIMSSSSSSSVVMGACKADADADAARWILSSASLPALERRPLRIRVVDAEDEGGPLERKLLPRETAVLEITEPEVGADGGSRGVGALMGVVDAEGAARGGLFAVDDAGPSSDS